MKFILTLQHGQCGLCSGVAVLWCHQKLPHPLPCPPAHPHPLELGQGCGSGATYPHPPAMLQLATQDPLKEEMLTKKGNLKNRN